MKRLWWVVVLLVTRAPVTPSRDALGPGHLHPAETLPHHQERPGALQRTGNSGLAASSPAERRQSLVIGDPANQPNQPEQSLSRRAFPWDQFCQNDERLVPAV